MEINEQSGSVISLKQAQEFSFSYQESVPFGIISYYAGRDKINLILNQENCIGLRIYMGYNAVLEQNNLVVVGVDNLQQDLTSGIILEELVTCPPICPKDSALIKIHDL